jgi:hypothetical protein
MRVYGAMRPYFEERLEAARERGGEGLIAELVRVEKEGGRMAHLPRVGCCRATMDAVWLSFNFSAASLKSLPERRTKNWTSLAKRASMLTSLVA